VLRFFSEAPKAKVSDATICKTDNGMIELFNFKVSAHAVLKCCEKVLN